MTNHPSMNSVGFKATSGNLTCCNDFQYEIGKVYEHTGPLKICESGFHLCKQLHQTFVFYSPKLSKGNRFFVVIYNDPTDNCNVKKKDDIVECSKVVTNAIRLEAEIKVEEHLEMTTMVKQYPTEHMVLYLARYGGSPYAKEVIKQLLKAKPNVHAYDDIVLQWASEGGHTEVVKLLLDRGADVHARDDQALRNASGEGHIEIVQLLLDHGANVHANHDRALLERGADLHALDDDALLWASARGHTEVVRLLLDKGADVHALDDAALRVASNYGYIEVVRLLLDYGADVHARGDIVLLIASQEGHDEVVKLLFQKHMT